MDKAEELKVLQAQYRELDKEAGRYNRPEFDEVYKSIKDLTKEHKDVGDNGNLVFPLVTGGVIDEALRLTGFADDATFVADFKKYREIEQQAREIQLQIILKKMAGQEPPKPQQVQGWCFYPISIVAPQQIQEEIITPMMQADAKKGEGLFANSTDFELEDEALDEYLAVDCYGLQCSFVPFLDELKQWGIVGEQAFLKKEFTKKLFCVLKQIATFIKDNTDKPQRIKNYITKCVGAFDDVPIWGLFFQILVLQGLCRWLEGVNINEGDNGFNEAQSLYNWLCKRLAEKEMNFCFTPYGDGDKERLKPLCDYLYSTEIGKLVQANLFGGDEENEPQQENETEKPADAKPNKDDMEAFTLPTELDTDKARKLFQKAIDAGYAQQTDSGYKWTKTKRLCAYFADKATEYLNISKAESSEGKSANWKPFEALFNLTGLKTCKQDWRKTGTLPRGYKDIDALFE